MRIVSGLFLLVISFLGCLYFRSYFGSVIPYPTLWYIFFILLGFVAAWLIFNSFRNANRIVNRELNHKIESFKKNAEKITLNFDLCEFKSGSYYHEVVDENTRTLNLISPFGFSHYPTKTEHVANSSLIYNYSISGSTERYIESFPVDQTTLKSYVLTGRIILYVDRFDRKKYYFTLES